MTHRRMVQGGVKNVWRNPHLHCGISRISQQRRPLKSVRCLSLLPQPEALLRLRSTINACKHAHDA